jgi:hypothetical protein
MLDLGRMRQAHKRFLVAHDRMVTLELENAAKGGVQWSKDHPGFQDVTGKTRAATEGLVLKTRRGHVMRLRNKLKTALWMDKGTRSHPITAKRKPLLKFYWHKMGRWHSAESVRHPGTRPYQFVYHGMQFARESAVRGLISGAAQISRTF